MDDFTRQGRQHSDDTKLKHLDQGLYEVLLGSTILPAVYLTSDYKEPWYQESSLYFDTTLYYVYLVTPRILHTKSRHVGSLICKHKKSNG